MPSLTSMFCRAVVGLLFLGGLASAAIMGFAGPFDPSLWTLTNTDTNGSVVTTGAPGSILLIGGNDDSGLPGQTLYSITVPADVVSVSFDWVYTSYDSSGLPFYDPAGYALGLVLNQLSSDFDLTTQAGSAGPVPVTAGDTFGFYVDTLDNVGGFATLGISNFQAEVPEPTTCVLVAVPLLLLGLAGRRRRSQKH
jgi:hypothetical protein